MNTKLSCLLLQPEFTPLMYHWVLLARCQGISPLQFRVFRQLRTPAVLTMMSFWPLQISTLRPLSRIYNSLIKLMLLGYDALGYKLEFVSHRLGEVVSEGQIHIVIIVPVVYARRDTETVLVGLEESSVVLVDIAGIVQSIVLDVDATEELVTNGLSVDDPVDVVRRSRVAAVEDVDHRLGLHEGYGVSSTGGGETHRVEGAVVEVDLVDWVHIAVADHNALEIDIEGAVEHEHAGENGDVMTGVALACQIQGILVQFPLGQEVVEEVGEVVSCGVRVGHHLLLIIRKAHADRLVGTQQVSKFVPTVRVLNDLVVLVSLNKQWAKLVEAPELRSASRASLQPHDDRDFLIREVGAWLLPKGVVHGGVALRIVPVDILIAGVGLKVEGVPDFVIIEGGSIHHGRNCGDDQNREEAEGEYRVVLHFESKTIWILYIFIQKLSLTQQRNIGYRIMIEPPLCQYENTTIIHIQLIIHSI